MTVTVVARILFFWWVKADTYFTFFALRLTWEHIWEAYMRRIYEKHIWEVYKIFHLLCIETPDEKSIQIDALSCCHHTAPGFLSELWENVLDHWTNCYIVGKVQMGRAFRLMPSYDPCVESIDNTLCYAGDDLRSMANANTYYVGQFPQLAWVEQDVDDIFYVSPYLICWLSLICSPYVGVFIKGLTIPVMFCFFLLQYLSY